MKSNRIFSKANQFSFLFALIMLFSIGISHKAKASVDEKTYNLLDILAAGPVSYPPAEDFKQLLRRAITVEPKVFSVGNHGFCFRVVTPDVHDVLETSLMSHWINESKIYNTVSKKPLLYADESQGIFIIVTLADGYIEITPFEKDDISLVVKTALGFPVLVAAKDEGYFNWWLGLPPRRSNDPSWRSSWGGLVQRLREKPREVAFNCSN